jgi:CBS domain-containing protein
VQVHQVMNKKVKTLRPDDDLAKAIHTLALSGGRHALVLDGKTLVGIVGEWDVLRAWSRGSVHSVTVRSLMTGNVHTVSADESVASVAARFVDERMGCFPVMQKGRLVGLVTSTDIVAALNEPAGDRPAKRAKAKTKRRRKLG